MTVIGVRVRRQKDGNSGAPSPLRSSPRKCFARVIRAAGKSIDTPLPEFVAMAFPLLLIKLVLTVRIMLLFIELVFQN